jgi:hydrogenase expression/formation protein HypC
MCLAVPAHVVDRDGSTALADLHGNRIRISLALVPEVAVGDWVLLHAGFAIQKLAFDEASDTFEALRDLVPAPRGGP